jgi:hopanoid biosynthesis associated protein HpnK
VHGPVSDTRSTRRLIVSADDFGMSSGVNAGILRAHRDGILTDAGLMVNGAAVDEAVEIARDVPSLSVGLHLVLVQGYATCSPRDIPDLVDASGRFRNHPIACGVRYFFQPGIRAQLEREIRAQLERYRSTGLDLSHVDGHLNIHMHPTVLSILIDLADELGIRAIRLSREALLPALRFDRGHLLRKSFEAAAFHALGANAVRRTADGPIRFADHMFGLHQTGHVGEEYLLRLLEELPEGVSEVYCHAGVVDEEAARWRPASYRSDLELAALTSPDVRAALQRLRIELTTYRELGDRGAATRPDGSQKLLGGR